MQQQQQFHDLYGHLQEGKSAKGSWLSRVSNRASHIPPPASLSNVAAPVTNSRSSTGTPPSTLTALPLRTSTNFTRLHEHLHATSTVHKASSYQPSPISPSTSPAETEFTATPIDASFDDRITQHPPTKLPPELLPAVRSRRGTATHLGATPLVTDGIMDKYARQAGDSAYDSDAEADDEFERSVFSSPIIAGHFADDHSDHESDSEDDDRSLLDGGDTPTTQGWADRDGRSPTGKITQWTEEEAADYLVSLSPALKLYGQRFVEEGINGEALIAIHHEELRELGVASVGHRMTILKAVYEQKMRAGVKIEEGDYVPLSAEGEKADMNATQDDISRIIESLRLRDKRIIAAEAELRAMKQDLDRISEENRKLREETLPIMRLVKDQRTPLPDPAGGTIPSPREMEHTRQSESLAFQQNKGSSLSRKFSTKKLFLKSDATKQSSPTHPPQSHTPQPREVRDDGGAHLEASAAAMAASTHLTASMTAQTSPSSVHGQQLSPVSPAHSTQPPGSGGSYGVNRSFPRDGNTSRHEHRAYGHTDDTGTGFSTSSQWSQASTVVPPDQPSARERDRTRRQAPTPSPREDEHAGTTREKDNPQVEIFKSFRVSIDDPCRVVLPVALKRYNITDDWRQYALYIVHGDQERCLGLEEKPLLLFKQLDKEGRKPMFMLRRHASPQEGWSGAAGSSMPTSSEAKIPGGVL